MKIEKNQLDDLVMKGDRPEARGAFGAVFKRTLHTKVQYATIIVSIFLSCTFTHTVGW